MSIKLQRRTVLGTALGLCIYPHAFAARGGAERGEVSLPYEEFQLQNGLRVILHRDRSTPIVAVNLWYHVGSKNEVPGRTGFAHLFEHMMFQGSKNHDTEYFQPLQEAGGNINGSTSNDRTNYYEVVPSNFLELALFLEADRMGGLLDTLTLDKLNNQRDVVKNERRQRVDNQPYGTVPERIMALLYPEGHPYHWPVIGSLADLTAASVDDVKEFFRRFYVPNNASLCLAGDFDPGQARKLVEKYFGPIPKGADIQRPNPMQPTLDKEVRVAFEDNVRLERLQIVWHTVPQYAADEAALEMLGAVLSGGRGSRLQAKLAYEKQMVQTVMAGQQGLEIAGTFRVTASPRPDFGWEEVLVEVDREIERIKWEPPTAQEMERAVNGIEARNIFGVQTVLGKANQFNGYATFLGKPGYFAEDFSRYRKVTSADVQRVASKYLTEKRLVFAVLPQEDGAAAGPVAPSADNQPTTDANASEKGGGSFRLPKAGPDPKFTLPRAERFRLTNGLDVRLVRQTELPVVSMNLVIKSGGAATPPGKAIVAAMTANLLTNGTRTRSALDIANQMQGLGATLRASEGWDSSEVNLVTLTKNLDAALGTFADVIVNPTFPADELELTRRRQMVALIQRKTNANMIAPGVYSSILYGKAHPYGYEALGDESAVRAITRADLETFYNTFYRPNNAVLVVVGDVTAKDLLPKLERAFATWKPGTIPTSTVPAVPTRDKTVLYLVDRPGSAQSVLNIGQVGAARNTPDYFPLVVMNNILGGQFFSRVNLNLREAKGYTYGARTEWDFRRGAGPFTASAQVQTAVTKESVVEFLKELRGIRGEIPVTTEELAYSKQSLIRRYPSGFETVGQVSGRLADLIVYDLPDTYFSDFIPRINAVTLEDVKRVANRYLDPARMAILVVGDRKAVEPKLREIPGLEIVFLDADGKPV